MKSCFLNKNFVLLVCLLFYSSCVSLQASTTLPLKEVIVGVNRFHKKALKMHAIRQPNTTFLGMPIRKWLYQWGVKRFDLEKAKQDLSNIQAIYAAKLANVTNEKEKKRLLAKRDKLIRLKKMICAQGNWCMRKGEKPVVYNPIYVEQNENFFLRYLHTMGYLDAKISSKADFQKGKVVVYYYITQNQLYKISSVSLQTSCKEIQSILLQHARERFLKPGNPYQYQDLVNERERVITLLSNKGYFGCGEQHVSFTAEVSQETYTIAITLLIDGAVQGTTPLKRTKIDSVIVDLTIPNDNGPKDQSVATTVFQDVIFKVASHRYSLQNLARKISIRPGDWYSKHKILETYERLHSVSLFKSITILPKIEAGKLVMYIHAIPYEYVKLQTEFGIECLNLNLQKLRPTIKVLPTIRPLCKGLGIAQIETSIGYKDYLSYQLRCAFTIPYFLFFLPEKLFFLLEDFMPKTTFDIGYSLSKETATYDKHKIDAVVAYRWCNRVKNISHQIKPCSMEMNYFQEKNKNGNNTKGSLDACTRQPTFLTSIGYICEIENRVPSYLSLLDSYKKWLFSIGIEYGGVYEYLFPIRKILSNRFQFCRYLKFDITHRYTFNLTRYTALAYQTKLGTIVVYGKTAKEVYDKQYEIGGYGSVRAWDTQMVGPGRYERRKKKDGKSKKQKGDLLLLGNVELRQKLIGYLEGALFVDVGNTWKLSKDALPEMKFDLRKFYQEFAVGGGFGLRLNFYNTFVLCGDIAIPLRRPSGMKRKDEELFKFNLNINYPF